MNFAVVDVETSGNSSIENRITEIGIVLTDGFSIIGKYEKLFNPQQEIPIFVQKMTGITSNLVKDAPVFQIHSTEIHNLLNEKIFVAHNVSFDYEFVKHSLHRSDIDWSAKKLCTFKLAKKILPNFTKFNVGFLAKYFGIAIENRHRAGSDALATACILQKIIENFGIEVVKESIN